jgi:alanyl-tRNA synthetase
MQSKQIREKFLQYFESKEHKRLRSSSLIPEGDPTLFFTNAGMVPFKNFFLGLEKPAFKRATTSQKCMRVSGKHNDLENVGRTHRHHTFFEMLGNFSFGDYFKKEAIEFAWEFLTKEMKINPNRLWITVFHEDDEAALIWEKAIGVAADRIIRLGEKDNFWSMGEEGPCGPCSEIHYDHGKEYSCGKPNCGVGCDCDRFMEVWNLVFMQFNRSSTGEMNPLPKPSVDTGMGLERLACVVQGVHSNYASDLFTPIIQTIEKKVGHSYGKEEKTDISIRVLADHIRAATFLIGDGVQPSNEGRGYVLRRILRRAIRHGWLLGMREPFFFSLADIVIHEMESAYPELAKHQRFISSVIHAEETRFLETLEKGLEILQSEFSAQKKSGNRCLSGELVFKLYDTFGFPVDLIQNIGDEEGFTVDMEGFENAMMGQRQTARRAWKGSGQERVAQVYQELSQKGIACEFLGYQTLTTESKIVALIRNGELVSEIKAGDEAQVVTEKTPFYGESGGQVGDKGFILSKNFKMEVQDTQKPMGDLIVHLGKVLQGTVKMGDVVKLEVDRQHRTPTRLNHTATHLLHAALRKVLGEHVRQAGSLVAPHRLRFDFSHFEPLSDEDLERIESLVNEKIREDLPVEKLEMTYDEALKTGAMALFGEKYGDRVRVLKINDFSTELCGGTHIDRTGEIGFFKIIEESSVAAGIRRIDALTGADAVHHARKMERNIKQLASRLKVGMGELPEKVEKMSEQIKKFEREITQLKQKLLSGGESQDFMSQVREKNGVKVIAVKRDNEDVKTLRSFSDQVLSKLTSGVALVASASEDKVTLIVRVSKDLTERFQAGNLIKPLAEIVGGSGGGRPDMAQAGGSHIEKLDEVIARFYDLV